jgi:HEAT repeat protein
MTVLVPLSPALAGIHRSDRWEVRVGVAQALAAADPRLALTPLTAAAADPHADVRKAAVIGLSSWGDQPAAERALRTALEDPDADVRAHARHGLAAVPAG